MSVAIRNSQDIARKKRKLDKTKLNVLKERDNKKKPQASTQLASKLTAVCRGLEKKVRR
jgi:hypothetical protein